jgi:uncharacterized protein (TIGR02271 family)
MSQPNPDRDAMDVPPGQPVVLPVAREQIVVGKEKRVTGRVRVRVTPHQRQQTVNTPLIEERVDIRRVPVNRPATGQEGVRQEGDVTIVPVFEEVWVAEKRLMVKEEIHIQRRRVETNRSQTVTLREESVEVVRDGPEGSGQGGGGGTDVAKESGPW